MSTVFVQNPKAGHLRLTNNSGAAVEQGQFLVLAGMAVIADDDIASTEIGSFQVEEDIVLQASDFVDGEGTFATENAAVYWDPSTGDFSDTSTATYYEVGTVVDALDSNGMITFRKYHDAVLISA